MSTIGVVSPGAMGSALGRAWLRGGARVVATVAGRSERTRRLADGLELLPALDDVVRVSDVVVGVCPPALAGDVLGAVLDAGVGGGVYVDLNATSPAGAVELADRCAAAGWDFVDGSISGGPPGGASTRETTVYLSGPNAQSLAVPPAPGLRTRVVGGDPGVASAVKMCTASVHKGTTALWAQAFETAAHFDLVDVVADDLAAAFPEATRGAAAMVALGVSKSERYVAEMDNIADTQAAAGLGRDLFAGMAAVYRRLATTPLASLSPEEARTRTDLDAVLASLRP